MWNNNVFAQRKDGATSMYQETIKGLEKTKELLNQRLANKTISDAEYMKKVKELNAKIEQYKSKLGG